MALSETVCNEYISLKASLQYIENKMSVYFDVVTFELRMLFQCNIQNSHKY